MDLSQIELPSNRKFGYFFTIVFMLLTIYLHGNDHTFSAFVFAATGAIFLFVTLLDADKLLPLNKLWMQLGFILGMIISPIILGVVFYVIFTPTALFMRIKGRDELRLGANNHKSFWILRSENIKSSSFKQQF